MHIHYARCDTLSIPGLVAISFADSNRITYEYDLFSRLTGVEYSNGAMIAYGYHDAGNMLSKTGIFQGGVSGMCREPGASDQCQLRIAY